MKIKVLSVIAVLCILLTLCSCGNSVNTIPTVSGECEVCGAEDLLYDCWDNGNKVIRRCSECADTWEASKKHNKDKSYTLNPATQEVILTERETIAAVKGSWTVTTDGDSYEWLFSYSTSGGGDVCTLKIINPVSGTALYSGTFDVNAPSSTIYYDVTPVQKTEDGASAYSFFLSYTANAAEDGGKPTIILTDSLGSTFEKNS